MDPDIITDSYPLLILNPPQGTKINSGDYILTLGSVSEEKMDAFFKDKIDKHEKAAKKDTKRLT